MDPLVSIIVRTKDRPLLLERALRSLAAQAYHPLEVVVVNDGGRPLDEARLRMLVGDARLELVPLPSTTGRAHAANVGLARAAGEFVGFLDDDDELLPWHVTKLVSAARRHGAAVVYSDCEFVRREIAPSGEILQEESEGRFFMAREFSHAVLLFENYIPLICLLLRRDAVAATGGFDESLELFEDWDFLLHLAETQEFRRVPEVTCRYVQWSRTEQIAFSDAVDGEAAYLRVLGKHLAKIGPAEIHRYYAETQGERRNEHGRRLSLERLLAGLERTISGLEARLAAAAKELEARERALRNATGEIAHLRSRLGEVTRTLDSITRSRAWKLIELYRRGIKERLLGSGTRRRALYNRLVRTGDHRPSAGPAGASSAASPPPAPRIVHERFMPPAATVAAAEALASKVSIVIPTYNAGQELRAVLERLRSQEGITDLEIIAVDSGSTDGTLSLCERHRVTVLPYAAASFNHGLARNQGASRASGDILIFMSQDAHPAGRRAVADIVTAISADPMLGAVSARQVPRSDADLFTCWQLWCYREKVLRYDSDTIVALEGGALASLAPEERHRAAQIDNVFSAVRRDVFERLQFRQVPIAEDLDLGMRMLEHGYRIGFLSSVAVVHSHNRPPAYHLRRSYAEWRMIASLLGYNTLDWPGPDGVTLAPVVRAAASLYRRIGALAAGVGGDPGTFARAIAEARAALEAPPAAGRPASEASLEAALGEIAGSLHLGAGGAEEPHLAVFKRFYRSLLASFAEYLSCRGAGDPGSGALDAVLFKLCGEAVGHCLADFRIRAERRGATPEGYDALDAVLGRGV